MNMLRQTAETSESPNGFELVRGAASEGVNQHLISGASWHLLNFTDLLVRGWIADVLMDGRRQRKGKKTTGLTLKDVETRENILLYFQNNEPVQYGMSVFVGETAYKSLFAKFPALGLRGGKLASLQLSMEHLGASLVDLYFDKNPDAQWSKESVQILLEGFLASQKGARVMPQMPRLKVPEEPIQFPKRREPDSIPPRPPKEKKQRRPQIPVPLQESIANQSMHQPTEVPDNHVQLSKSQVESLRSWVKSAGLNITALKAVAKPFPYHYTVALLKTYMKKKALLDVPHGLLMAILDCVKGVYQEKVASALRQDTASPDLSLAFRSFYERLTGIVYTDAAPEQSGTKPESRPEVQEERTYIAIEKIDMLFACGPALGFAQDYLEVTLQLDLQEVDRLKKMTTDFAVVDVAYRELREAFQEKISSNGHFPPDIREQLLRLGFTLPPLQLEDTPQVDPEVQALIERQLDAMCEEVVTLLRTRLLLVLETMNSSQTPITLPRRHLHTVPLAADTGDMMHSLEAVVHLMGQTLEMETDEERGLVHFFLAPVEPVPSEAAESVKLDDDSADSDELAETVVEEVIEEKDEEETAPEALASKATTLHVPIVTLGPILQLVNFHKLTPEEIAKETGAPLESVARYIPRRYKRLRARKMPARFLYKLCRMLLDRQKPFDAADKFTPVSSRFIRSIKARTEELGDIPEEDKIERLDPADMMTVSAKELRALNLLIGTYWKDNMEVAEATGIDLEEIEALLPWVPGVFKEKDISAGILLALLDAMREVHEKTRFVTADQGRIKNKLKTLSHLLSVLGKDMDWRSLPYRYGS